jgi:hypothetical protein
MSFNGPALNNYGGTAVKAYGNGFLFDNVWFQGIRNGIEAQGSFINTDNCVAEFCFEAVKTTAALDESMWRGWTMYKNETDFSISGSNKTFTIRDVNCIATVTKCFAMQCSGMLIDGVTFQDDGTGRRPELFEIIGAENVINNVLITSFGNRGFSFLGAGTTKNRVSNVMIYNVPNGILFSEASSNSVSNVTIRDCQSGYGIYFDTCTDNTIENFLLQGNNYNVRISAATNNALYNGQMANAVTADFYFPVVNTASIFISNVRANFAGIAALPYKQQTLSGGQKQVMATAAPTHQRGKLAIYVSIQTQLLGNQKGGDAPLRALRGLGYPKAICNKRKYHGASKNSPN